MPIERTPQLESVPEQQENPLKLQRDKWKVLKKKIDSYLTKTSADERREFIEKIMDYSVVDGVGLASKFGEKPRAVIGSSSFVVHHPDLSAKVYDYVSAHEDRFRNDEDRDDALNFAGRLADMAKSAGQTKARDDAFYKEQETRNNKRKGGSPGFKGLLTQTENYYAEFLKNRSVREARYIDPLTEGEKIGEGALEKIKRAVQGEYFAGPVLDFVYLHTPKKFKNPKLTRNESLRKFLSSKGIDSDSLDRIFTASFLGASDAVSLVGEVTNIFPEDLKDKKYRPLDIVVNTERNDGIKKLTEELNARVVDYDPNAHVAFDENSGRYVIEGKTKPSFKFDIGEFEKRDLPGMVWPRTLAYQGGELAYVTIQSGMKFNVVLPNNEIIEGVHVPSDHINIVDGNTYFIEGKDEFGKNPTTILHKNSEILETGQEKVKGIQTFENKLFCCFHDQNGTERAGLLSGERFSDYDEINHMYTNDESLVYTAKKGKDWTIVQMVKDDSLPTGFKEVSHSMGEKIHEL